MYQPDKIFPLPESLPVETVRGSWRKALLDAAEYIRVHGLCKNGAFSNPAGEVCAWGALSRVSGGETFGRAMYALERRVGHIPSWNDQPGTTPEHVIEVLTQVARSALREGG